MSDENTTTGEITVAAERPGPVDPAAAQAEIERLEALIATSQAEINALSGGPTQAPPESYDAKAQYRVQFARSVTMGSFRYTPRQGTLLLKGSALTRIVDEHGAEAIRAVEKA